MEKFFVEKSIFYATKAKENFTEAEISCSKNSSTIANLSNVNFKRFVKKLINYRDLNLDNFFRVLRVHSLKSGHHDCYGLIDLSWLNVDEDTSKNVKEVCIGDRDFVWGKYKTLCSRKLDKSDLLSDSSSEGGSPVLEIVLTLVAIVIIGTLIVLFFYFKRKRRTKLMQKSSVCRIELVESSKEVRNSYFLTV